MIGKPRRRGGATGGTGQALLGVVALLLALLATPSPAHATRRVFLWFADGGQPPKSARKICSGAGIPPAFQCPLGSSVDACRAPILALLDHWYADFDVVFSYALPAVAPAPTGDAGAEAYDTVVVANDGAWCGSDAQVVSRSPLPPCTDPGPGGAVAIFRCGSDTKKCATLIAKEQGHLVGLQHTGSATDVMNELGTTDHDGFEDRDNLSAAPRCDRLQNSYRLMLARLGAWPGGAKPGPGLPPPPNLPGVPDGAAVPEPGDAAGGPAEDASGGGPDAASPTLPETGPDPRGPDAGTAAAAASEGGCSCRLGGGAASAGWSVPLGLAWLAAARGRRRRPRAPRLEIVSRM